MFLLVPAYPGCPDKRPLNGFVVVVVVVAIIDESVICSHYLFFKQKLLTMFIA